MEGIFELSPYVVPLVPILIGLVGVIKTMGLPSRFAPAASLVLGIGLMFFVPQVTIGVVVVQGIIAGLMASGLYSGVKKTFETA